MCKVEDGFKFCTCLDEKGIETEPDALVWTLGRINPQLPHRGLRGRCMPNRLTKDDKELSTQILEAINSRNCFDFEYSPQKNDNLHIRLSSGRVLSFRYKSDCWQVDKSDRFASWKSKLERLNDGKII